MDYAQRIDAAIGACDALVVLIGGDWLDVQCPDGRRRLDDPGDVLRREITAALARDILVIPVLVEGATMPSEQKLASDIAPLARRNALELSDTRVAASNGCGSPPARHSPSCLLSPVSPCLSSPLAARTAR